MTSVPSDGPADDGPAPPRRHRRGEVTRFGRTCAAAGCETTLSMYNRDERCWKHAQEQEAQERRARS